MKGNNLLNKESNQPANQAAETPDAKASSAPSSNNSEAIDTPEAVPTETPLTLQDVAYDPTATPIWELAAQMRAKVPDEEWAKLPTDLARNFDHYQKQRLEQD